MDGLDHRYLLKDVLARYEENDKKSKMADAAAIASRGLSGARDCGWFKLGPRPDDTVAVMTKTCPKRPSGNSGILAAIILALFFGSGGLSCLVAEDVQDPGLGWGCNIPETWVLENADPQGGAYTFRDSRGHALFQVLLVMKPESKTARQLLSTVAGNLKATIPEEHKEDAAKAPGGPLAFGETGFKVNESEAWLADLEWKLGETPMRGYVVGMDGRKFDVVLIASALGTEWAGYHKFLLSVLDSFYMDADAAQLPGLLTQFVANDGWAGGHIADPAPAIDASQSMIEREAWVLNQYQKAGEDAQKKAWRRFYQMAYRDAFLRLEETALAMKTVFDREKIERKDIPVKLLHYVQAFKYEEPDSLSDLRSPYDAVLKRLGDCDSRCLVYMILMEHFGFDCRLMISPVHHHSLVGVDMAGEGARFPSEGKQWLVAETTVTVPLGLIHKDMANPADWIGMNLHITP